MITYRKDFGLWWPDYDIAPERTLAYVRKHLRDVEATITASQSRRVCVQAGGHVGLWPLRLAACFDIVLTFEPDPALFQCLIRNTHHAPNVICHSTALSSEDGESAMRPHEKAGSWSVDPAGSVRIQTTTIDYVLRDYGFTSCDAIVLDIEGHELEALRGAADTIARCSPVIHIEELKARGAEASSYVRSLGYRERARFGHDALYTLPELSRN